MLSEKINIHIVPIIDVEIKKYCHQLLSIDKLSKSKEGIEIPNDIIIQIRDPIHLIFLVFHFMMLSTG